MPPSWGVQVPKAGLTWVMSVHGLGLVLGGLPQAMGEAGVQVRVRCVEP